MGNGAIEALRHNRNESFHFNEIPESIEDNEYVSLEKRDEFPCPEPSCGRPAEVADDGDNGLVSCGQHVKDYDNQNKFWTIDTEKAIRDLLDGKDFNLEDKKFYYICDIDDSRFMIVPGKVKKSKKIELLNNAIESEKLCVIAFKEDLISELREISQLMGGLTMVVKPPNIQRKIETFREFDEFSQELEEVSGSQEHQLSPRLVDMVKEHPLNAVEELINFEKIESSKKRREELEELSVLTLARLYDFPLKTLGMKSVGERVPDGIGLLRDGQDHQKGILIVDAKSVSSGNRDYPDINEKDSPQYKKYLEKAEKISKVKDIPNKILLFVAPEFNKSKADDFCEELKEQGYEDYQVIFFTLSGLSIALKATESYFTERAIRNNVENKRSMLYKLLMSSEFDRTEQQYELALNNAEVLTGKNVKEHISSFLQEYSIDEEVKDLSHIIAD